MQVLFVCTGNSCRSPMAELYFNSLCRKAGRSDISAASAGTCACDDVSISAQAAHVLRHHGIDSAGFRARALTPEIAEQADLIVAMTAFHAEETGLIAPGCGKKIHLLLEFSGESGDIPDPYGGSYECYDSVLSRMIPALESLFKQMANNQK